MPVSRTETTVGGFNDLAFKYHYTGYPHKRQGRQ